MKNLVISILSAILITGMGFWEYDVPEDRWWVCFTLTLVLFVTLMSFDEWLRDRRRKKKRARIMEQFRQKNRP